MEQSADRLQAAKLSVSSTSTQTWQQAKEPARQDVTTTRKTKSRYGCRGCKSRRLKCDETKPSCTQCLRRGRECPGYARDFKFSDKHEKLRFVGNEYGQTRKRKRTAVPQEHTPKSQTTDTSTPLPPIARPAPSAMEKQQQQVGDTADGPDPDLSEPHLDVMDLIFGDILAPDISESLDTGPLRSSKAPSPAASLVIDEDHHIVQNSRDLVEMHRITEMDVNLESAVIDPQSLSISTAPPRKRKRRPSDQLLQKAKSKIPTTPIDLPTTLIEYWFTHVCPMWSAYDSETNPNRQLALKSCFTSECVFYALQSMSAACLVDSLPHMKSVLVSSSGNALAAINRDMGIYYDLNSSLDDALPTDLLLATFAMATSLCWTDTKQLGEPLVVGARTILMRHEDSTGGRGDEAYKDLSHFRHALKYTEMLLNFVSSESAFGDLEKMRRRHRKRLRQLLKLELDPDEVKEEVDVVGANFGPEEDDLESVLHPWTGVSQRTQERFGLVMALCRDHHTRTRSNNVHNASALCESLCDIEVARELASDLIKSAFDSDSDAATSFMLTSTLETGDVSTPLAHLLDTAEAYRLAALLQLYLTFPDLEVCLDDPVTSSEHGVVDDGEDLTRDQALSSLTLLLVDVLQRIPADSGTRCIQPVLYVSCATGLRFDTPVTVDPEVMPLTQCTIEISRARQFIIDRLSTLLRSLPPRPIGVALNLVKAIWAEYDYGKHSAAGGHWMDVMVRTGLQTLFG